MTIKYKKYSVYLMEISNLISKNKGKSKYTICISVENDYFLTINTQSYDFEKDDELIIKIADYSFLKYDSYIRINRPIQISDNSYCLAKTPKYLCDLNQNTINEIKKIALNSKKLQKMFKIYFE